MRPEPSSTRSRAGRWCSRALVVLGGAVAGSAAALALSTSTASASPIGDWPNGDTHPVTDAAVAGLGDIADSGVSAVAGAVSGQVPGPDVAQDGRHNRDDDAGKPASEDERSEGSEQAGADPAAGSAQPAGSRPVGRTLGAVTQLLDQPQDTPRMLGEALESPERITEFGEQMWEFVSPSGQHGLLPAPRLPFDRAEQADRETAPAGPKSVTTSRAVTGTAVAPPQPHGAAPHTKAGETARELSRTGDPVPARQPAIQRGDLPQSPGSLPVNPFRTPSAPAGSAGGTHLDSPHFAVSAADLSAFDSAATGSLRSGVGSLPLQPKSQPGVSPD